jgi:hypothetical protein
MPLDQHLGLWWGGECVALKKLRFVMMGLGMQSDDVTGGIKGKRPLFPVVVCWIKMCQEVGVGIIRMGVQGLKKFRKASPFSHLSPI